MIRKLFPPGQHLADGGQVVGQAGHQVAGLGVLEIAERQPLEVGEQGVPDVPLDVPGEAEDVGAPEVAEDPLADCGENDQGGIAEEVPRVIPGRRQAVQGQAREPRDQKMHDIRAQQGQDAQKEEPAMPAEERPDVLQALDDGVPPEGKSGSDGKNILQCDGAVCKGFVQASTLDLFLTGCPGWGEIHPGDGPRHGTRH